MEQDANKVMKSLVLGTWAHDAGKCLTCGVEWTEEAIIQRDPRVASVSPRLLVCSGPCWDGWIKKSQNP